MLLPQEAPLVHQNMEGEKNKTKLWSWTKTKGPPFTGCLIPRPSLTAMPWGAEATLPALWSPLPGSGEYQAQGRYSTDSLYQLLPIDEVPGLGMPSNSRSCLLGGQKEHPCPPGRSWHGRRVRRVAGAGEGRTGQSAFSDHLLARADAQTQTSLCRPSHAFAKMPWRGHHNR